MKSAPTSSPDSPASTEFDPRRLARVIFPKRGEPSDVRSLYIVENPAAPDRVAADGRTSARIPARTEISFETYFNALPASYWRRWSQLDEVLLRIELTGDARVDVYRSKLDGARIAVTGETTEAGAEGRSVLEFVVSLAPFEDGGWIWFDISCESDTIIHSAGWYATVDAGPQEIHSERAVLDNPVTGESTEFGRGDLLPAAPPRLTVGIPTFNRPTDAVAALHALASDPQVDGVIDAVIMPDQGDKHPADEPDFGEVEAHFGDRLRIVRQGNLGGSGGYSRIMYEARHAERGTDSPYILYMDDDIVIEPDSILRALAAARYSSRPMLIGGQMLNLQERSHLHTMGEIVDRSDFIWKNAPNSHYDHDFFNHPLRDRGENLPEGAEKTKTPNNYLHSRDLHRRIDVDYNGWWMCLIPRVVADTIGQPLPLFIKWDDSEYGLRASSHGFPTASWPSIAIWHMAWSDKDDAIDWQAYFHLRNRLVVTALHYDGDIKAIIKTLYKSLFKHMTCLEYSTVRIQSEAIRDFLRGPEALEEMLPAALPKVQALRKEYPDAVQLRSATELPQASGFPGVTDEPKSAPAKAKALLKGMAHNLRPHDPRNHEVPQINIPPADARWYCLGRVDGATVTSADGRGVYFRQRDRAKAAELVRETLQMHRELNRRFPELRRRYREAHADLVSKEAWSRVFDEQ